MALRGDIKTFSLSAVGRMIHEESKTGVLEVTSGAQSTRIYFKNGGIVFLKGNMAEDLSLGALLKAKGLIDEARIQQALQAAGAAGKRLGVVLIEQGYISKENLVRFLHYQFKEAVTHMLAWQEGEFEYTDGLGDYVEDIHLTIDPIRLVAEAQKWKEFRHHIPNDQVVFQIKDSRKKLPSFDSEAALRVMLLIDGQRNVDHIMRATGLSRLAVYKALTTLVHHGIIARKTAAQGATRELHQDWYTIVEVFLSLLDTLMANMSAELGRQRAAAHVASCLRLHPAYEQGLNLIETEKDLQTNLKRIKTHGARSLQRMASNELVDGFLAVVIGLCRDVYQVLGFKVAQQMIDNLCQGLKQAPAARQQLALMIIETLQPYAVNEGLLRETPHREASDRSAAAVKTPPASPIKYLDRISASSIIAFYHQVFQLLVRELEHDIGSQGASLFKRRVAAGNGKENLLATFDLDTSIADNIKNLRDYISSRGYTLAKETLVQAFQTLMAGVTGEEKNLLGPRATRQTLQNLEASLQYIKQENYGPLKEHLVAFSRQLADRLGG